MSAPQQIKYRGRIYVQAAGDKHSSEGLALQARIQQVARLRPLADIIASYITYGEAGGPPVSEAQRNEEVYATIRLMNKLVQHKKDMDAHARDEL